MDTLLNLINKYDSLTQDELKSYNEQGTRQEFIDVFLNILGWDVTNSKSEKYSEREVMVEEITNSTDRPDYTIRRQGQSQFFIEAKRLSLDILNSSDSAFQTKRYGWNAGHKITVLTNFENLIIYQTFEEPNENDAEFKYRYKHYNYTEYVTKYDEIHSLISREAVFSGDFDIWTDDITPEHATKTSLNNIFLQSLNKWRIYFSQALLDSGKDEYKDTENLNIATQRILNQVIFLRFAEDNELENSDVIHKLYNDQINTKQFLKELDNKYNSELFTDYYIEDIPNDVLSKVVKQLYYPNSSYDFSIIPLGILSQMYENYLQYEIALEGEDVKLIPTLDRKIKSIVSTPMEIVSYMVKEGLEEKTTGASIDEILNLKICDLSVGSGVFLIEVYDYLESELIDRYASIHSLEPSPAIVPFKDKAMIISRVLNGFDINPLAVQLTRFSLQLRVLSGTTSYNVSDYPILPTLQYNIISSNSLVNENDLDLNDLTTKEFKDIIPGTSDSLIFDSFDLIIGNPPYLKVEDIKNSTSIKEIDVYKQKYISSYGQYDKYFLFIELVINMILANSENDATSILIVPNKFFNAKSGIKLREFIKENSVLDQIIDFHNIQLFDGVIIYVCILKFKTNQNNFEYSRVIPTELTTTTSLTYDSDLLTDEGWFLVDDQELRTVYEYARSNFPPITSEIAVSNGIQTSKNNVYVIKTKELISETDDYVEFKKRDNIFKIEKSILRKYYEKNNPKDIGKSYSYVDSNAYVIFPYINGKSISPEILQSQFPLAWAYFSSFREELATRNVRSGNKDHWYRYGRHQYLQEADMDKILVGVMSNQPNFNIDRRNHLFSSGGTAGYISIIMKEDSDYALEYVKAWLSHSFTDNIFKVIGSDFEGAFYTHGTYLYDAIPFLTINFEDAVETDYYDSIVENVNTIEGINEDLIVEINIMNKSTLERRKQILINQINESIDTLIDMKMGDEN